VKPAAARLRDTVLKENCDEMKEMIMSFPKAVEMLSIGMEKIRAYEDLFHPDEGRFYPDCVSLHCLCLLTCLHAYNDRQL
jgi:hypothetical protein